MSDAITTPKLAEDDPDVEGTDPTEEPSRSSLDLNLENSRAEEGGESHGSNNNNNENKKNNEATRTASETQSRLSSNILFDGSSCRTCEATKLPSTKGDEEVEQGEGGEEGEEEKTSSCWRIARRMCQFYWNNEFACSVVVAVLFAWIYPPLGADYLAPKITSTWIGVMLIFRT